MSHRAPRRAPFPIFASILLFSARILAATPADWYGVSLNVDIEASDGTIQSATIRDTFPNSPASEQHVAAGDRVIEIEGQRVAGATLQRFSSLIDKTAGEALRMWLQRPNGEFYYAVLVAAAAPGQ